LNGRHFLFSPLGYGNTQLATFYRQTCASDPLAESRPFMKDEAEDQSVLKVIQHLAAEEHRLYQHEALTDADRAWLAKINIELDQCWDLLRQQQR
jgi:Protein of unknown function (DUF2630)